MISIPFPLIATFSSILGISTIALSLLYFVSNTSFVEKYDAQLIAFSIGCLVGDVFFHLIPHLFSHDDDPMHLSTLILIGIIIGYILENIITVFHVGGHHHGHHHNSETSTDKSKNSQQENKPQSMVKRFAWTNLAGDFLHNFVDGIAIGSAFVSDYNIGIATSIAVLFHEIGAEMGDYCILLKGGFTSKQAIIANIFTSCAALLGGLFAVTMGSLIQGFALQLLAITGGLFLYLALTDLIPTLHDSIEHHKQSAITIFLAMLVGLGLMKLLLILEEEHGHGHDGTNHSDHDHSNDPHDHL